MQWIFPVSVDMFWVYLLSVFACALSVFSVILTVWQRTRLVRMVEIMGAELDKLDGILAAARNLSIEEVARHATIELRRQLVVTEVDPDHGEEQVTYHAMGWARCADCHGVSLEAWQENCETRDCWMARDARMAIGQECLTGDRSLL